MFKVLLFTLAVFALAHSAPVEKTPEESRAELLAAGLSPQAVDGIMQIGASASTQFQNTTPSPLEAIGATIKFFQDLDAFIKTQSPEDQAAYNALMEKKKQEFEAQFSNGKH